MVNVKEILKMYTDTLTKLDSKGNRNEQFAYTNQERALLAVYDMGWGDAYVRYSTDEDEDEDEDD